MVIAWLNRESAEPMVAANSLEAASEITVE